MHSHLKTLIGAGAAFALSISPTIATAATTTAVQPVNPLIAVSLFGTQASAQTVCSAGTSATVAAGSAAVAQGQAGCVLPAIDTPPPVIEGPPPPPPAGNFGVNWLLLGLGALALLAGISTLFDDDDDDGQVLSPT